jgi:tol-pal system protein YbgF
MNSGRKAWKAVGAAVLAAGLLASAGTGADAQLFGSRSSSQGNVGDAATLSRLDQLETQVRNLTGQVEEYQHRIRVLEERLERFQADTEYRFQENGGPASAGAPRPGPQARNEPPSSAPLNLPQTESGAPRFATPPAATREADLQQQPGYGGLRPLAPVNSGFPPAASGPMDISPPSRAGGGYQQDLVPQQQTGPSGISGNSGNAGGSSAQAALGGAGDPQSTYDIAYAFILQRDYVSAGEAFNDFLQRYPQDKLAGNAQYWLGESYYAQGQYREAADAFLTGYTQYESGGKAPDSLLKLGMSLQALGQKDAACASFAEFSKKFPGASKSMMNRVQAEQKGAGC